jgi:hypothetical protein
VDTIGLFTCHLASNAPNQYEPHWGAVQVASGGDPDGYLDFYAVHGYPIWDEPVRDSLINMFRHGKTHWNVSKPILVGEHWEQVSAASS